jgi:hypothetical protein
MIVSPIRWLIVLGAVASGTSSVAAAADPFTVGVLSCAAESDRDRRLDCYDRAVANFTAGLSGGKRESAVGVAPSADAGEKSGVRRGSPAVASVPNGGAAVSESRAATPAPAGQTGGAAEAGSPAATVGTAGAAPTARHVAARIVSIDHFPDYVVVHLDNQQIWKQVSESPGGLILRTGDPVTIDRQVGSYWLAGPKGEAVQVKLEAPQ